MVKILQRGEIDVWPVGATVQCHTCHTLFEVEPGDNYTLDEDQRDPGLFVRISCPVCHEKAIAYKDET